MNIVKTLNGLIDDVDNGDIDTLAELQRELIHLRSELEQLSLCGVGKPSYCVDESYHKIDRCKKQCSDCKEIQSCFKQ